MTSKDFSYNEGAAGESELSLLCHYKVVHLEVSKEAQNKWYTMMNGVCSDSTKGWKWVAEYKRSQSLDQYTFWNSHVSVSLKPLLPVEKNIN